jgi:tryptophan-rich sensory protein
MRITLGDAVSVGAPLAVGGLGGIATVSSLGTWYRGLRKPAWNPPDAVFGPVWTALYLLMGVALALSRRAAAGRDERRRAETVFGLQLSLNLAWSFAFFSARSPAAGVAVILVLWASIVATIAEFGRVRRLAAVLLVPYLAWVTFAAILNLEIWRLNTWVPPAGVRPSSA